jgi:SsrA-binding protein
MKSPEITTNRKALRDYFIVERFEAGIELKGTELKSIRAGFANLTNAFARVENGEVFLMEADIRTYDNASHEQHVPKRPRRLLLHKAEILKLFSASAIEGQTLVALGMYWKKSRVKVEIGIGKGKVSHDKRADLKEKATKRETDREVARFNKRHT